MWSLYYWPKHEVNLGPSCWLLREIASYRFGDYSFWEFAQRWKSWPPGIAAHHVPDAGTSDIAAGARLLGAFASSANDCNHCLFEEKRKAHMQFGCYTLDTDANLQWDKVQQLKSYSFDRYWHPLLFGVQSRPKEVYTVDMLLTLYIRANSSETHLQRSHLPKVRFNEVHLVWDAVSNSFIRMRAEMVIWWSYFSLTDCLYVMVKLYN